MRIELELPARLEPADELSPLGRARVHRKLSVEAAARRAGLPPEEVGWLESGRLYRFPSTERALLAALVYAGALGIGQSEARSLAGLPPVHVESSTLVRRLLVLGGLAIVVGALAAIFALPHAKPHVARARPDRPGPPLPATWRISADVLNGAGDVNYTRQMASRIGALAYRIVHVGPAPRFDYRTTVVYYEPGGRRIAERLAGSLAAHVKPLPGGRNPRHLVVIVGPKNGP
jgi:hypothetical protein